MRTLIIILCAILLGACTPQKRLTWLYNKYPELLPDTSTHVEYVERIELDTITVHTDPDTFALIIPIPCPDTEISTETSEGGIKVVIKDSILTVVADCKADSLEVVVQELTKELTTKETVVLKVPYEPPENMRLVKHFWFKLYKGSFWILLILVIVSITVLVVKYKAKIISSAGRVRKFFG